MNKAVKTYKYVDNTWISDNFVAMEFRCKCGRNHDTVISEELAKKLQEMISILDTDIVVIASGYRCAEHDKDVGGNGYGQHTKGTTAGVIFYKKAQR